MIKPITLFAAAVVVLLIAHLAYASSTWALSITPSNTFVQNTPGAAIEITGTSNSLVLLFADGHLIEGGKAPFNYSISDWVAGGHLIVAKDNSTGINQTTYLTILPPPGTGGTAPIRNTTVAITKGINTTKSLSLNAVQSSLLSMYSYDVAFRGVNGSLDIPLWYMAEAALLFASVILYVKTGKFQYPLLLAIGIFAAFVIMGV